MAEAWPRLIALAGRARSGKDTSADYFCRLGYARYSFAMPLKWGLQRMLGLTVDHTDGDLKELPVEPYGVSPRVMMQTIGTEWGRNLINENIWLLRAEQVIAEWLRDDPELKGVVLPDVRFENEASWVREQGGLIVHLERPGTTEVAAHASESGIAPHQDDYLVLNDGSIDELNEQLADIMRAFCDGRERPVDGGVP